MRGENLFDFLWDDSLGAGLQMALFDAAGKLSGVPCHRLMGRQQREACPASWWAQSMKPEAWAAEVREAEKHGFTTMKVKARPWYDIDRQLEAVGKAASPHFRVDADFNELLLGVDGAAPLLGRLEDPQGAGATQAFDAFFLFLVLLVTVSGVLTEAGRYVFESALACYIYIVHLGSVLCLYATAPYSKFAHMMYRTLAMVHERMVAAPAQPDVAGEDFSEEEESGDRE